MSGSRKSMSKQSEDAIFGLDDGQDYRYPVGEGILQVQGGEQCRQAIDQGYCDRESSSLTGCSRIHLHLGVLSKPM